MSCGALTQISPSSPPVAMVPSGCTRRTSTPCTGVPTVTPPRSGSLGEAAATTGASVSPYDDSTGTSNRLRTSSTSPSGGTCPPPVNARTSGNSGCRSRRCRSTNARWSAGVDPASVTPSRASTSHTPSVSSEPVRMLAHPDPRLARSQTTPSTCAAGRSRAWRSWGMSPNRWISPRAAASSDASVWRTSFGSPVPPAVWNSHRTGSHPGRGSTGSTSSSGGRVVGSPHTEIPAALYRSIGAPCFATTPSAHPFTSSKSAMALSARLLQVSPVRRRTGRRRKQVVPLPAQAREHHTQRHQCQDQCQCAQPVDVPLVRHLSSLSRLPGCQMSRAARCAAG